MKQIIAPATGKDITEMKTDTIEDLDTAVSAAKTAQKAWRELPAGSRARYILKMREYLVANADEVSGIIAECSGKMLNDAMVTETLPAVLASGYYAKKITKMLKPRPLGISSIIFFNKRSYLHFEPYGVIGIISPWNYPFGIPFHEVITSLLAGNTVVLKVATQVQPVGEIFARMADYAGLPDQVLSIINLPGATAGNAFIHSGIDKLFFTGSVSVGQALMAEAAKVLLPVSLELGGNDAMIVCEDAHPLRAAGGAAWGGLSNAGQSCGGVERVYVHEKIYDEFMKHLENIVADMRQGTGGDADIGAMTTIRQKETVEAHIKDALEKGAVIRIRSEAAEGANYLPAVVLENVTHDMDVMKHETFGPVLAVCKVKSEEEAVSLANDSYLGLTASVWTSSKRRADRIAAKLEAGAVTVNDHLMSHGMAETPWGGYKMSSIGRSHGGPGLYEVVQSKVVVHDIMHRFKRNIWWYPYSEAVYDGLKSAMYGLHGKGLFLRVGNLLKTAVFYIKKLSE